MKKIIFAILMYFTIQSALCAEDYDLKRCVAYAIKNKSSAIVVKLDSIVDEKKIKEQIGAGLPQIEATGTFTDNVKIATQLMPGSLMGTTDGSMVAIKNGTNYNLSGAITLTQKVYDNSFWVALEAAKLNSVYTNQKILKEYEQIIYDVINAYYKVIIERKLVNNFKELVASSLKTLNSTETKYQNGAAKKIDIDRIKVNYNNSKSQYEQAVLTKTQYINNLKYAMGMSIDDSLTLSEIDEQELMKKAYIVSAGKYNFDNRIDYQMQKTNIDIIDLSKKKYQSEYIPTVSLTASYTVEAMRDKIDFLSQNKDYYGSSYLSLVVKVPIFSGFTTKAKIEQAEINSQIEKENLKALEQSINTNIANYLLQYKNAIENIKSQKDNLVLAQSVLENTRLEFSQGKSSAMELFDAETSLKEAQNNYYSQLLSLCIAELDFEKQKGTIINIINNIK